MPEQAKTQPIITEDGPELAAIERDCCVGNAAFHIDTLVRSLRAALAAKQAAKVDGWCDVCAGTGKLPSGVPCICGGTGRACDAVSALRVLLFDVEKERDEALKLLQEYRWRWHATLHANVCIHCGKNARRGG